MLPANSDRQSARPPWFALPALLAVLVLLVVPFAKGHFPVRAPLGAFGAFYCGGTLVRERANPYRVEPLRTCERALPSYQYDSNDVVEPVPLPGFALLPFAALSLLPFTVALYAWVALLVACTLAAVVWLRALTGLPLAVVACSLAVAALYENILYAEIPVMAIAALAGAALALVRRRPTLAAVAVSVALIEPHVCAPAALALFIYVPRARRALAICAALLAAASLATIGPAVSLEYFTRALPVHAAAEIPAADQMSLTWLLHWLGVPDRAALFAGTLSYVVIALGGIWLAARAARRVQHPELLVVLPPAIAMLGGSFIHDLQFTLAIPAALVLLSLQRRAAAPIVALAILCVPWHYDLRAVAAGAIVVATLVTAAIPWLPSGRRLAVGLGAAAVYVVFLFVAAKLPKPPAVTPSAYAAPIADDTRIASVVWGEFVRRSSYGAFSFETLADKLPLWYCIGLLVVTAAQLRPQDEPAALVS